MHKHRPPLTHIPLKGAARHELGTRKPASPADPGQLDKWASFRALCLRGKKALVFLIHRSGSCNGGRFPCAQARPLLSTFWWHFSFDFPCFLLIYLEGSFWQDSWLCFPLCRSCIISSTFSETGLIATCGLQEGAGWNEGEKTQLGKGETPISSPDSTLSIEFQLHFPVFWCYVQRQNPQLQEAG